MNEPLPGWPQRDVTGPETPGEYEGHTTRGTFPHWQQREQVLERFEVAWQEQGEPRIEEFLPIDEAAGRTPLLAELIKIDLEYRWDRGGRPKVEEYLERFGELAASPSVVDDLISEEIHVRSHQGCAPTNAELRERFPNRPELVHASAAVTKPMATSSGRSIGRSKVPVRLGRYEVREIKGEGGCAAVYRGWDPELRREVAIKVPRAGFVADAEGQARLLREATSAARLRHPAIVPIYETGKQGDTAYIVFEYVPGPSLAQVLHETRPTPRQAAQWVARIADALDYAHRSGIVHRDVKPSNILMDANGQPLLSDFGLAFTSEGGPTLTQHGDILGTPAYMSPEQARGRSQTVDARTDVYSLGVLLYELLCGRVPFEGPGHSVLLQVLHDEPSTPRRYRAQTPADLETICLKAMSKEPRRRYATAGAMADDLCRYLEHRPIHARRIGPLGRFTRWCRRRPALAATIAGAVLAIAAVSGASFRQVLQERNRYRVERDRAEASLYQALVSDCRAQLRSRDTGWWWTAMDDIRQAARLGVAEKDPATLRELAIQCMGTSYPCFRLRQTWQGHQGPVTGIAFSRDGRLAVSGSRDKSLRLWERASGRTIAVLDGHNAAVTGVAYHADGRRIASASADGTVRIWDVEALVNVPPSEPDANLDAPPSRVFTLGDEPVRAIAFSSDGRLLAAAYKDAVQVFDVMDPGEEKTAKVLVGDSNAPDDAPSDPAAKTPAVLTCLAFAPNDHRLATGGSDKTLRIWHVDSGQPIDSWPVGAVPRTLAFDFENFALFWADAEGFLVHTRIINRHEEISTARLHTDSIRQVFVAGNTKPSRLLTASQDGSIKYWFDPRFTTETAVARGGFRDVLCAAIETSGRWVVAGHADGTIRLWELASPPQRTLHRPSHNVDFIGDERRLACDDHVLDFSSDRPAAEEPFDVAPVVALAIYPDGDRFALARGDGTLLVWDRAARREVASWKAHDCTITSLAVDRDGLRLATGSEDSEVKIWDGDTGRLRESADAGIGEVDQVAWSVDGHSLAAAGRRGAVLWHVDEGVELDELLADAPAGTLRRRLTLRRTLHEHLVPMGVVAFGAEHLVTARADGAIELRDPRSGTISDTLFGHTTAVTAIAFSADGAMLASTGLERTIRLWDLATRRELGRFNFPDRETTRYLTWLSFDPHGKYLLSGGQWWAAGRGGPRTAVWNVQSRTTVAWGLPASRAGRFLPDGSGALVADPMGGVALYSIENIEAAARATLAASRDWPATIEAPTAVMPGGHSEIWGVATSPDGRWIATASHGGTAKLWDARTLKLVHSFEPNEGVLWSVAFSRDSKLLASGSGTVKVWEVESGREVHSFAGHERLIVSLAFHPTRPWLVSSSLDGTVRIWDLDADRPLVLLHGFDSPVHNLAFRPDGRWLAAACHDQHVALWELGDSSGEPGPRPPDRLLQGHTSAVWAVGFSADGLWLASGADQGQVILWDGERFARKVSLETNSGQVRCLSFSRDGGLLAATGGYAAGNEVSQTIVWDLDKVHAALQEMKLDW
jgi:WD40 repeat protein